MINYYLIGKRIGEMRRLRKLSQAELAELTHMSVTYISYIENAKRKASLQSLVLISSIMGITVDMLLSGNQGHDRNEYQNDILLLMEDCSTYEKRVIFELMLSLKTSLRNNECLLSNPE